MRSYCVDAGDLGLAACDEADPFGFHAGRGGDGVIAETGGLGGVEDGAEGACGHGLHDHGVCKQTPRERGSLRPDVEGSTWLPEGCNKLINALYADGPRR